MKRIIAAIVVMTAFAVASTAHAATGLVGVTCNSFTFVYQDFPDGTTVNYYVVVYDSSQASSAEPGAHTSGVLTLSGSGSITVSVPNIEGHVNVTVYWAGGYQYGSGQLGDCSLPATVAPTPPTHGYCGPSGFAQLLFRQPDWDPVWKGYTPAAFVEGLGIMCPWDIPAGYKDSGTTVDPAGANYGNEEGADYEYWVRE